MGSEDVYKRQEFNQRGSAQADADITTPLPMALHVDSSLFVTALDLLGYDYIHYTLPAYKHDKEGEANVGVFIRRVAWFW